jgi:glycerol-3-phosphate acyltransferase PlsX
MSRIAIDAMGGDHAPGEIVHGAIAAANDGIDVVLVGDTAVIEPILTVAGVALPVVHAEEAIGMADDPGRAIREKKESSVAVAARLVASGEAAGFVSAGSTGAAMEAAALGVGRLRGVGRPAIASFFPNRKIVLDAGANLACKAEHLAQFAVMGAALAQSHFGVDTPRVGLVNIGEEEGKGRDLEREAFALLAALPGIDFVGNLEGRDLAQDTADVFVTDGFTGNVVLKTAEGASRLVIEALQGALAASDHAGDVSRLAAALGDLTATFDPEMTGGAHLLGTRAVVVIAHGSSTRVATVNAIRLAAEGVEHGLVEKITLGLAAVAAPAG